MLLTYSPSTDTWHAQSTRAMSDAQEVADAQAIAQALDTDTLVDVLATISGSDYTTVDTHGIVTR